VPADGVIKRSAPTHGLSELSLPMIPMGDSRYVLLNYWAPLPKLLSRSGLSTRSVLPHGQGGIIRFCSSERRQKRVMHVDNPQRVVCHEGWRENLHIASQHNQIGRVTRKQFELSSFHFCFCFCDHRQVVERNTVILRQRTRILVIADD
jgi:hypothetical protein